MKQFKIITVALFLFAYLFLFSGGIVAAPSNMTNKDMKLQYNVYAGGMHALKASLNMSLDTKKYDIALEAKTNGLIGKLFPWRGHFETFGETTEEGFIPAKYESTSYWKNKAKITLLEYENGSVKAKKSIKDGKEKLETNFKDNLTQDTVDMLTGAIKILQTAGKENSCNGSVPVFDGKRRFNLVFREVGKSVIRKSKYSVFSGEAIKCIVEVKPVLGFKKKDYKRGWLAVQNHTKKRNKLPTIWLAKLDKDGPTIPVRMEIASSYGTVIAHLTATND